MSDLFESFNAELYWADKPYKKWVSMFVWRDDKHKEVRRFVYTQAANMERATRCARRNAMIPPKANVYTKLATPKDLGCSLIADSKS